MAEPNSGASTSNRDSSSLIHRLGVTPETNSIVSSKNRIYAIPSEDDSGAKAQIGVISSFSPTESRNVETVRGIGYGDIIAELVPGFTDPMSISIERTAQYLSNLFNVFGYKGGVGGIVRSLRHHKWPFDIVQEIVVSQLAIDGIDTTKKGMEVVPGETGPSGKHLKAIVTYYQGCWINNFSTSYTSDSALVQESVDVNVTDVLANADGSSLVTATPDAYSDEFSDDLFNIDAKSTLYDTSTT